ncbi:MAG: FAD-dependent oxidoreductase [Gammaproteobacteria bacterium]|nr:MAG: FAD-dependent oxidoreductase [Gammaproteobacteria bacterium]
MPDVVVVIGAGLIGLTTAYELLQRGRQVLVLDAGPDVAQGASHANGSILTPSMADPWNSPGVHRHLLASVVDRRAALVLRVSALPSLWLWGLRFLRNSSPTRHRAATLDSFLLSNYSLRRTRELRERLSLDYGSTTRGTMRLFRDGENLQRALALAQMLGEHGLRFALLDRAAAVEAEPQLAPVAARIAGALRFPDDEGGDAYRFCVALATRIEDCGGRIRRGLGARGILVRQGTVCGVDSGDGVIATSEVIVACGVDSQKLVNPLGIDLAIRPAKGYSLTLDVSSVSGCPQAPLVEDSLHVAIAPMGDQLRIAGTAEFAGMDRSIRPERIENLFEALVATYPDVARQVERRTAVSWAGLRPMSSDGLPTVGPSRVRGLYVNAGHGHLGWTMAVGSAHMLADLITGVAPAINASPYRVGR